MTTSTTWIPPPVETLDYSRNCTAFGRFVQETMSGNIDVRLDWDGVNQLSVQNWSAASTQTVVDMLQSALPPDYHQHTYPTAEQLMHWFLGNHALIISYTLSYTPCRTEICDAVGFRGTGEVIGTGVCVSG